MKWVRAKAKRLSLLALFALAIQLGLSFGHIHSDPAWSTSRAQTIVSSSSSSHSGLQPDADEVCEICVTIAMVSTAMHSAPPMLPLPARWSPTAFAPSELADSFPVRLAAFQSRGPPLS